ncbi:hypothetical protein V6N13_059742 [Hibiscus sabdariffa]
MKVRSAMYNLEVKQKYRPNYLSADKTNLPSVYFLSSLVYFTLAGIWIYFIYKRRLTLSRIHFFMLALVILKAFNLIFEAGSKSYIKRTGIVDDCWNVVANVAQVFADEAPPFSPYKATWNTIVMLIGIICYCTLLLPIVWRIKNLREVAQTDEKVAAYLMKLKQLRQYYIVVICYVYLTCIVVVSALLMIPSFEYPSGVVVGELATVAFYVFTAYKFMPKAHNPYSAIEDEVKDDAAAKLLKLEDGDDVPLLFFSSFDLPFCFAEIRFVEIQSDSHPIIPFDNFRFTEDGYLELNVSQITLWNHSRYLYSGEVGFFLCTRDAWLNVLQQLAHGHIRCALETYLVKHVYDFSSLKGKSNFYTFFPVYHVNRYTLVFANCLSQVNVSMKVRSEMYNLEIKQKYRPNYLSADETILPSVYILSSLVYFTLAGIWIYIIYRTRVTLSRIHFFVLALVISKALNLIFEAANKSHIKRTVIVNDCWNVPLHILSFLKGIKFFTLLVSIGTDWSPLKHYLQHKVNKVSMIVIPLQASWNTMVMLIDIVCYCVVLLPIVWRIKNLREAAQTDEKAAVYLMKLKLLRQYYIVVICYVYLTCIVVSALLTITSFEYPWTGVVVRELATVAFYVFTAHKFMPEAHNPYFVIEDEVKDVAAELLKLEYGEGENGE